MSRRSRLMAHEPQLSMVMAGHPNDWQSVTDNLKTTAETFAYWCAHRLKISLKAYHEHVDGDRQWWMLAAEAKAIGAVDGVSDSVRQVYMAMLAGKI